MADLSANLYDLNKDLTMQEPPLTSIEIKDKIHQYVTPFFKDSLSQYFMLLCRERYDFTLFNFNEGKSDFKLRKAGQQDMYTCLVNRGKVVTIEPTEAKDAIEIWIIIDEEAYCYYLFPYDMGVIEV